MVTLHDHSSQPRFGLKGTNINPSLPGYGLQIGPDSNRAYLQENSSLAARLGPNELLVLNGSNEIQDSHECYLVPRRDTHYWYSVEGEDAPAMLAKLCGVDLHPRVFDDLQVAQTRLANTTVVIVRHDGSQGTRYHLLGDSSYSAYLWSCLEDAAEEFS